jgi:hypothetical protein
MRYLGPALGIWRNMACETMSTIQTHHSVVAPKDDRAVPPILTSWKDIAQYVGKGVRTLQRWERELGFPVRRTKPGGKGSVLAFRTEIDSWAKSQQLTAWPLEFDQATLLSSLRELRIENRELRCQLASLQGAGLTVSKPRP